MATGDGLAKHRRRENPLERVVEMSARKSKVEQEEQLAEYLEAHKDEGDWEEVEFQRPSKVSSVYSIRFTAQELDALQVMASREGKRVSQIVREAVSQYVERRQESKTRSFVDWSNRQFITFTGSNESTKTAAPRVDVKRWTLPA